MSAARKLALIGIGALLGGRCRGLAPFARYTYGRVGSTDLQRVDRWTGRVDWAGDGGWWNMADQTAMIEAEVHNFESRARQIVESGKSGDLLSVKVMGRQLTVYPVRGQPFKAYAAEIGDPRLTELVKDLRAFRVSVDGA